MKKFSLLFFSYCLLTGGVLASTFLDRSQPEVSSVENRELMTLPNFLAESASLTHFQNGVFQSRFQRLINDQFPLRNLLLKAEFNYEALRSALIAQGFGNSDHPILFKNGEFYQINDSGYYISVPLRASEEKNQIFENRMWNFEEIYKKYDDRLKMYVYKPTLADETDWFDETFIYPSEGEKYFIRMSDQLEGKITVMQQQFDSIEDYMQQHFKTDHHWNHLGAYQGYTDIITLIQSDFREIPDPYPIESSFCLAVPFYGSLSMKTMGTYGYDSFCDYRLAQENTLEVLVDGIDKKPGLEEKVLEEDLSEIYLYEEYHGTNVKMIEYTNPALKNGPSILILADSFSNSINDDLALHFKKTYVVDPRAWTNDDDPMNTIFSLDAFLAEHDVDILLWLQYYESLYFDSRMYMHIDLNY